MKVLAALLAATFAATFLSAQLPAQQPALPQPAPIPSAILSAKKLFLSNGGHGVGIPKQDPNTTFNRFDAALKSSGHFDLVDDPADADLVLELQVPILDPKGISMVLTIFDRKSHYILWTIRKETPGCSLVSTCERNVAALPATLAADFLVLAG